MVFLDGGGAIITLGSLGPTSLVGGLVVIGRRVSPAPRHGNWVYDARNPRKLGFTIAPREWDTIRMERSSLRLFNKITTIK